MPQSTISNLQFYLQGLRGKRGNRGHSLGSEIVSITQMSDIVLIESQWRQINNVSFGSLVGRESPYVSPSE